MHTLVVTLGARPAGLYQVAQLSRLAAVRAKVKNKLVSPLWKHTDPKLAPASLPTRFREEVSASARAIYHARVGFSDDPLRLLHERHGRWDLEHEGAGRKRAGISLGQRAQSEAYHQERMGEQHLRRGRRTWLHHWVRRDIVNVNQS